MKNSFFEKVNKFVAKIPRGKVATYGQIAGFCGSPRSARAVGLSLRNLPSDTRVPWQRVVSSSGMISIENLSVPKAEQVSRLQADGIEVILKNGNYWVNLKKYLWSGGRAKHTTG